MGQQEREGDLSMQTRRLLDAFLEDPATQLAAADIRKRTGLSAPTLYPLLLRLEAVGWLASRWETIHPPGVAHPRRRLYCLTPAGLGHASATFVRFGTSAPA